MSKEGMYRMDGVDPLERDVKRIFDSLRQNVFETHEAGSGWRIETFTDNLGVEHIRVNRTLSDSEENGWEMNEYSGDAYPLESDAPPQEDYP